MSGPTANVDTHVAQHTEFHPRRPRDEPMTTHGHKPGVQASPYDRVPEHHAETFPPGTAPRENTYVPRPDGENAGPREYGTSAADSLGGSTSASVHNATEYGKPLQGQGGRELQHDGGHGRKKERTGLGGVAGAEGVDVSRQKGADLPEGINKGTSGKAHPDYPSAEERLPQSAESVAGENNGPKGRVYGSGERRT